MNRRNKNKPLIQSHASPLGGVRGCLCWDTATYSPDCCDGSIQAQGVGSITRTD